MKSKYEEGIYFIDSKEIKRLTPMLFKRFCKNNHDTFINGRYSDGSCKECRRKNYIPHPRIKKQFCINRHDTFIVGRNFQGMCRECKRIKDCIWKKANPEKVKIFSYKYRKENPEKVKESRDRCYNNNPEKAIIHSRKWAKENPEKVSVNRRKWRKNNPNKTAQYNLKQHTNRSLRIPQWGQEGIIEFYNNCPEDMGVDHIIPLLGKKVSGFHVRKNLQYLTPHENALKHNQFDGTLQNNSWRNQI